ncbi:MAG: carboxylating nicotinate-nucleotide diphosphorylase [Cyclobacteriaceae bacterium]|nr:carboxylating nicotinate-nucleotide diphosphorylase [Cyclobacteriaceae bacterium]MCH8515912.1 carboxylating nicotinate-nucleotide diphosphorylase [Cyclobacteriaceae bacterium]
MEKHIYSDFDTFIVTALNEDIGEGDHSSLSIPALNTPVEAVLICKDQGVIAGLNLFVRVFGLLDPEVEVKLCFADGDKVSYGDELAILKGKARSILSGERVALNILQRMSGIASLTARLKSMIAHTEAQLLDTRKTTPNFRQFEKLAVKIGGGQNHRMGLYDMIMLKDNHVDYAGGIREAIQAAKKYLTEKQLDIPIEVETRSLEEVKEVVEEGGVSFVMLDNMSPDVMREAVNWVSGRVKLEASGGITEETIAEVASSGVDYISIGALTHSYKSLDISLRAKKK